MAAWLATEVVAEQIQLALYSNGTLDRLRPHQRKQATPALIVDVEVWRTQSFVSMPCYTGFATKND
jgi:hypothetical protein